MQRSDLDGYERITARRVTRRWMQQRPRRARPKSQWLPILLDGFSAIFARRTKDSIRVRCTSDTSHGPLLFACGCHGERRAALNCSVAVRVQQPGVRREEARTGQPEEHNSSPGARRLEIAPRVHSNRLPQTPPPPRSSAPQAAAPPHKPPPAPRDDHERPRPQSAGPGPDHEGGHQS